jgi:hypothetical protein
MSDLVNKAVVGTVSTKKTDVLMGLSGELLSAQSDLFGRLIQMHERVIGIDPETAPALPPSDNVGILARIETNIRDAQIWLGAIHNLVTKLEQDL